MQLHVSAAWVSQAQMLHVHGAISRLVTCFPGRTDLKALFEMLDEDASGEIDPEETQFAALPGGHSSSKSGIPHNPVLRGPGDHGVREGVRNWENPKQSF